MQAATQMMRLIAQRLETHLRRDQAVSRTGCRAFEPHCFVAGAWAREYRGVQRSAVAALPRGSLNQIVGRGGWAPSCQHPPCHWLGLDKRLMGLAAIVTRGHACTICALPSIKGVGAILSAAAALDPARGGEAVAHLAAGARVLRLGESSSGNCLWAYKESKAQREKTLVLDLSCH